MPERIRLGLIGDNIKNSRAPDLHRIAGQLCGLDVSYDLLIPKELGMDFDGTFAHARQSGMRGLNITYPYKEEVISRITIEDPLIGRIGSANTIVFGDGEPKGFNTDYTGFIAAFRTAFGTATPGRVLMVGAGGAGKAVAFGLTVLKAKKLIIVDQDGAKAKALADAIQAATDGKTQAMVADSVELAMDDADGVVNCTPVGMHGYPGSSVPDACFAGKTWAFDAVYTPINTRFSQQAEAAGVPFLSGYELFFHQGIQAFALFTGREVEDLAELRARLERGA